MLVRSDASIRSIASRKRFVSVSTSCVTFCLRTFSNSRLAASVSFRLKYARAIKARAGALFGTAARTRSSANTASVFLPIASAGALRLERDKEVVSGLRIAVIELLSGRDKKLVGGQSAQRNSRDERKKQREALHMPHGTSRSLS